MKFLTSNGVVRLWTRILEKLKGSCITYDNQTSLLDATNVQAAIDEVVITRLGDCYLKYENGKYYIGHDTATETEV